MTITKRTLCVTLVAGLLPLLGCGSDEIDSNEQARQAYLGLDHSIDKAIDLGLKGFSEASSANIPPQTTTGDKTGTMTVSGHVDQGSSSNKTMNLNIEMFGYSDDGKITYTTAAGDAGTAELPALSMGLKNLPNGTVDGTMTGTFHMTGDLEGEVTLNLAFTGALTQADGGTSQQVVRQTGSTHITGTAQSSNGLYTVDVTR